MNGKGVEGKWGLFTTGNTYGVGGATTQVPEEVLGRIFSSFIANGSTPSGLGLGCTCSLADDLIGISSVVKLGS